MTMYEGGWVPQGWQCPVCKRVYAPDWPFCTNCGEEKVVTSDRVTVGDTPGNMHDTRTVNDESGRLKLPETYTLVMPVDKQPKVTLDDESTL